jgi:hypothetical protein
MNTQNRYIKKFAKPDPRACSQQAYEQVLNDIYSAMTFEEVVVELGYLTEHGKVEMPGQFANLKRSYELKRLARFLNRHDKPKFMAMYREWKSLQPVVPL